MERIGRFEVQALLGSGTFGSVHRAYDPVLDLQVAIKVLSQDFAANPEVRERFINEARVMRRMESPRVVTVYDIAELPTGEPYFVMQLTSRGTLADRLAKHRSDGVPMTLADLRAVVTGLGKGLEVAHGAGVIHRDIKPSNVLITEAPTGVSPDAADGTALLLPGEFLVLADFGIAKNLADTGVVTAIAGTANYMAPEQQVLGGHIDHRADLYSATAVVAEMLMALEGRADPATRQALDIARQRMDAAISRGTAHRPDGRHPDAASWASDLAEAIDAGVSGSTLEFPQVRGDSSQLLDPLPGPPPPTGPPTEATRRRRRWPLGIAVAAVLLLVAGAGIWGALRFLPDLGGETPAVQVVGPPTVTLGNTWIYYADVDGDVVVTWELPDGTTLSDHVIEYTPTSTGTERIRLTADGFTGDEFEIDVVPPVPGFAIEGVEPGSLPPTSVDLTGTDVTLRAGTGRRVSEYHWVDWNGGTHDGETITLSPTAPGPLRIELAGVQDGSDVSVVHFITVLP